MRAKIQKWGNRQGLRITKALLADARINVGDDVNITVKEGALIVTPTQRIRKKYNLKDLVEKIPEGCLVKETDWGKPMGKEVELITVQNVRQGIEGHRSHTPNPL